MRSLECSLIFYDWCPYKKGNWNTETQTPGEHHVKTEIKVMCLRAKDHQRLPANRQKLGERHGADPLAWPQKELALLTC